MKLFENVKEKKINIKGLKISCLINKFNLNVYYQITFPVYP